MLFHHHFVLAQHYHFHYPVWVTKGLFNNMVHFLLHKNLKAWRNNFVTILAEVELRRCMSSKRNTTPNFRLGHLLFLGSPLQTWACPGNWGTLSRSSASLRSWMSIRPSLFTSSFRNSSSRRCSSATECEPLGPEAWTLITPVWSARSLCYVSSRIPRVLDKPRRWNNNNDNWRMHLILQYFVADIHKTCC